MSTASLVVEDGTGVAGADSYVDLAEATQFWCDFWGGDLWATLSVDEQTQALRSAALELACHCWCGTNASVDQGLDWPRVGGGMPTGLVPDAIKQAQIRVALQLASGGSTSASGGSAPGVVPVSAISAPGGFSVKFSEGRAGIDLSAGACGADVVPLDATGAAPVQDDIGCLLGAYICKPKAGPRMLAVCR